MLANQPFGALYRSRHNLLDVFGCTGYIDKARRFCLHYRASFVEVSTHLKMVLWSETGWWTRNGCKSNIVPASLTHCLQKLPEQTYDAP